MVSDLRLPWSNTVTATDASPAGWGICETELPTADVWRCGRWHERWRFRRLDPGEWKPRQRVIHRDLFTDPLTVRGTVDQVDDLHGYVENETFPEVPDHILQPSSWHTVGMGMWKHTDEHITMQEATCLLLAVRRMSRPRRHRHRRHLIFLDNLALRFALGKGRSQNYGMLRILQQIGSISLACALTLQSRWIPNEKNVADGPSRGQIALGAVSKSCAKVVQKSFKSSKPMSRTVTRPPVSMPPQTLQVLSLKQMRDVPLAKFKAVGSKRHLPPVGVVVSPQNRSRRSIPSIPALDVEKAGDIGQKPWHHSLEAEECQHRNAEPIPEILAALRGLL